MTIVSLDHLLNMVTEVRTHIVLDYKADLDAAIRFVYGEDAIQFAAPLLTNQSRGGKLEQPCGAIYYGFQKNMDGTGTARFELLPRMPESRQDLEFGDDIDPLVCIVAGKYHFNGKRYTYIDSEMLGDESDESHLPLIPVAMDILKRFAQQQEKLPTDLNDCENISIAA